MLMQFLATPDGAFGMLADEDQTLIAAGWTDQVAALLARLPAAERTAEPRPAQLGAADAVAAYYDNDFAAIGSVPVRQTGTEFSQQAWHVLRTIPAGQLLTYTQFAAQIGRPRAVRAAASACARNAVALFVPCHRVARGDGSMGGFAWGVQVKAALLAREMA